MCLRRLDQKRRYLTCWSPGPEGFSYQVSSLAALSHHLWGAQRGAMEKLCAEETAPARSAQLKSAPPCGPTPLGQAKASPHSPHAADL